MAERRMFAKTILESDAFMDLPDSAKVLYFYLNMASDDDGFCNSPRSIMRTCGAKDDDMKLLIAKKFILIFQSGVIVIKHWRIHNYIRSDRHHATKYTDLLSDMYLDENNAYSMSNTGTPAVGIPNVNQVVDKVDTEVRLGKVRLGKSKDSIESVEDKSLREGEITSDEHQSEIPPHSSSQKQIDYEGLVRAAAKYGRIEKARHYAESAKQFGVIIDVEKILEDAKSET